MSTFDDVEPTDPYVIVLFGATGDLAKRKLLPGLLRLYEAGMLKQVHIVGTSLDDMDDEAFRALARQACTDFGHGEMTDERWTPFGSMLTFVSTKEGPAKLAEHVKEARQDLPDGARLLHYFSVPPKAALDVMHQLESADLVEGARIIMEKPFGTDLKSAIDLNSKIHEVFAEEQIFRIDHFLGKEAAQNILAFRFANGLFEIGRAHV